MGFGIVHNILLTREFAGDKRLFWKCCSMEVNGLWNESIALVS